MHTDIHTNTQSVCHKYWNSHSQKPGAGCMSIAIRFVGDESFVGKKKKRDSWRKRLETAVYLQSCEPGESVHAGMTPAKGLIVSGEAKVSLLLLLDIFVLVRAQKLARQCSE